MFPESGEFFDSFNRSARRAG